MSQEDVFNTAFIDLLMKIVESRDFDELQKSIYASMTSEWRDELKRRATPPKTQGYPTMTQIEQHDCRHWWVPVVEDAAATLEQGTRTPKLEPIRAVCSICGKRRGFDHDH